MAFCFLASNERCRKIDSETAANVALRRPAFGAVGDLQEFKHRIKTQTVLPSADTAAMLFWALLASGQINMRKVDGWQGLATKPIDQPFELAA
jgi:hypothetical protein